jgi:hypothetical protein
MSRLSRPASARNRQLKAECVRYGIRIQRRLERVTLIPDAPPLLLLQTVPIGDVSERLARRAALQLAARAARRTDARLASFFTRGV